MFRQMIVPTRRFWFLVALGIPLALVGIWVAGWEPIVLLYNILLFGALVVTRFMTPNSKSLRIHRVADEVLSVNAANKVELVLENEGGAVMKGRILDECPPDFDSTPREFPLSLAPGEGKTLLYEVRPNNRGSDYFPATFVRFTAPLGLCEVQHRLETTQPVETYPNISAVREFDILNQKGRLGLMGVRRTRYRGQGTEFESLRDYDHDDFRRIDWKTTARRGKLVVRDYEVERNQVVFIVIDAGRHMLSEASGRLKFDHMLDTALLMMHAAERAGDQVGLIVFAERTLKYVPPRRGRMHVSMLLEAIHDLKARPVESNFGSLMAMFATRWKRRALVVLFTDIEEKREATKLLGAIKPIRNRHLWFIVRVMDPRLKELAVAPLKEESDLYKLGAYHWYAQRREEARIALTHQGVRNIEAEPEELAGVLVNAYWQAKQAGSL